MLFNDGLALNPVHWCMYVTNFLEHFSCSYFPLPLIQLNENVFSSKIIKLVDVTYSSSSYLRKSSAPAVNC